MRRTVFLIVAAMLIVTMAFAVRSHPDRREQPVDPAAGVNGRRPVPAAVMSTLRRACFDCHSNETRWPWYSSLPGASWAIERDVNAGRGQLNFSRWAEYNAFDRASLLDKACELATARKMPLLPYRLLHTEARLSAYDIAALCAWTEIEATRLVEGGL